MTAVLRFLWAALRAVLMALVYRYGRGGGLPLPGTQAARATWMVMAAVAAWSATLPADWRWPLIGLTTTLAWMALVASGHGEHQDMGRMRPGYSADGKPYELFTWPFRALDARQEQWRPWARELFDGAMMSWIGFWRGVITMGAVWPYDWRFAALWTAGSALMGPAYWLGYRAPWRLPGLGFGAEWGELFTGLAIGLALLFR